MIVKNIIIDCAKYLELSDVLEYLNSESQEITEDVSEKLNTLLIAVNMTNNLIASIYFELIDCINVEVQNNIVPFSNISNKNIVEIKNVYDDNNFKIPFKVLSDGVHINYSKVKIEYSYLPDPVNLESDINYYLKLNSLLFAQGVVGEYLFLKGNIDEAYSWDKRFKDTLFAMSKPKRNINMPSKRWL